jgi:lipopolysaccharide heptosyltransferase II
MRKPEVGVLPARLLVDLPNWLGDLVHALPALLSLRRGNHDGETWALLPAGHVPLARLLGLEVIERPTGAGFRFGRRLRGRFDVAVTARHSTRAKLLLAGIGAPLRLASRGRGAAALGLATFPVVRSRHQRHDLDGALLALGVPAPGDGRFLLPLPADLVAVGSRHRWLLGDGSPIVAMLPATRGGNGKQYPLERYEVVARKLVRAGTAVVVIVGPGEEALATRLAGSSGALVAPTAWPLGETAALLAACDAAVGNDSGLTHLAAVVGCPTVALFGPTEPGRTAPVGPAVILRTLSPAGAGGPRSLDTLSPADIVGAVEDLLVRSGQRIAGAPAPLAQPADIGARSSLGPRR